ncbi:hypothetical protein ABZP36_000463 [Zizania latifolia]
MNAVGLQPDAVTFLGVLSACVHAGLVDCGKHYFESMRTIYAVKQFPDHYACVVDLYGRAGLIEEAHCFVKAMPVKPHAGVWGVLLNACRKHCHVDVGIVVAVKSELAEEREIAVEAAEEEKDSVKTHEEVRKVFNIINDFSPQEQQEVRLDNAWRLGCCLLSDISPAPPLL